jgi:hypothetical protein
MYSAYVFVVEYVDQRAALKPFLEWPGLKTKGVSGLRWRRSRAAFASVVAVRESQGETVEPVVSGSAAGVPAATVGDVSAGMGASSDGNISREPSGSSQGT